MYAMSQKLGVDLIKDAELRWVIRDCLLSLKEEGWSCVLKGANDIAFVHVATEESRSFHSSVEMHRQLKKKQPNHVAIMIFDRSRGVSAVFKVWPSGCCSTRRTWPGKVWTASTGSRRSSSS